MSLSKTVSGWSKELGRIGKEPTPAERFDGRRVRKERKAENAKRKYAAKMKKGGYPGLFINKNEQETN